MVQFGEVKDWLCNSHGWQISNSHLKVALGIKPSEHWPDEGIMEMRYLGNVQVWVKPKQEDAEEAPGGWSSRAMCACPACNEIMNAGRLHQHAQAKHPVQLDAAKRSARNE